MLNDSRVKSSDDLQHSEIICDNDICDNPAKSTMYQWTILCHSYANAKYH